MNNRPCALSSNLPSADRPVPFANGSRANGHQSTLAAGVSCRGQAERPPIKLYPEAPEVSRIARGILALPDARVKKFDSPPPVPGPFVEREGPGQVIDFRVYRRLFRQCRTVNRVNNLHILLEQRITPAEVFALAHHILLENSPSVIRWPANFVLRLADFCLRKRIAVPGLPTIERYVQRRNWIIYLRRKVLQAGDSVSGRFRRRVVNQDVVLYSASLRNSRLVIAFSPRIRNMTVSMPVFLNALTESKADFLFIKPNLAAKGPWQEVAGFGPGFGALVAGIRKLVADEGYEEWHTVGLSYSAPLSLMVGLALGSATVSPIGLTKDLVGLASDYPDIWPESFRKLQRTESKGLDAVNLVVGAESDRDLAVAKSLVESLDAVGVLILESAGHSPLGELLRAGSLQVFLTSMVQGFPVGAPFTARRNFDYESRSAGLPEGCT